jgi:hypothetical protein
MITGMIELSSRLFDVGVAHVRNLDQRLTRVNHQYQSGGHEACSHPDAMSCYAVPRCILVSKQHEVSPVLDERMNWQDGRIPSVYLSKSDEAFS